MQTLLEGITVINLTQFLASAAGYMLGDLGASVIKIEEPGRGDAYRGMSQMYGEAMTSSTGIEHVGFEAANRNQRSLTLNLKDPRGRQVLYRLVARSDAFITNFTEETLHELGAGYDTLSAINPLLVYGVTSNYGPAGPLAGRRGFDQTAQARSGLMFAMGERDFAEPVQTVSGICDLAAATMLAYGVLAALVGRFRSGIGQKIDTSLLGAMLHLQVPGLTVTSIRGRSWARHSRQRCKNPFTNHYRCADGKWLLFAELQADRFWQEFCQVLGLGQYEHDPRFETATGGRREHAEELIAILDQVIATRTRDEWIRAFEEAGVPFAYAPVFDYSEVLNDRQAIENGYITDYDHVRAGHVKLVGCPVRFSKTPASIQREAPEFGQHTEEVLLEMGGYSWEELAVLKAAGVI